MQLRNKRVCLLTILAFLTGAVEANADLKIGDAFPDLAACKLEGKLPDLPANTVMLVDFWASWCGPCARSFPAMDELQRKYGAKGLVVIAVNVDEKKADMENFLKTRNLSFCVVRDAAQKLVEKTGITSMPSSFLIGKNGKVAFAHSGFHGSETKKQYEQEIESLLKEDNK
jgi:cytochrome c biogenesis protein CcmG, thiol:disulfide interchange protein DsbE